MIAHDLLQTLIAEKQNALYALITGNSVAILLFDVSFIGKVVLGLTLSIISGACIKGVEFGLHEWKAYRTGQPNVFTKK